MPRVILRKPKRAEPKPPNGVIVCLQVPKPLAERLALPGGEPVADLHVTLAFLGKLDALPEDRIFRTILNVREIARSAKRVRATVGGLGRFSLPEQDAFFATVDSPALIGLWQRVVGACRQAGLEPAANHGFYPHITLKYLNAGEGLPLNRLGPESVEFDHLEVWAGPQRHAYELEG